MSNPIFAFFGKKYGSLGEFQGGALNAGYSTLLPITPSATPLANVSRAIFASAAGTITGQDAYGNAITNFPVVQGENRLMLSQVSAVSTGLLVWAGY